MKKAERLHDLIKNYCRSLSNHASKAVYFKYVELLCKEAKRAASLKHKSDIDKLLVAWLNADERLQASEDEAFAVALEHIKQTEDALFQWAGVKRQEDQIL